MRVVRRQHAIGQGAFHSASISFGATGPHATEASFNYIYDCGSDDYRALAREIDVFVHRTNRINALFISHLDTDHVHGLDQLLGGTEVETVYMPYVDDLTVLMELLESASTTGLTGSLTEASLDPANYFGRRGVRRVVRILPGGGPGSDGPRVPEPSSGPEFREEPISSKEDPPPRLVSRATDERAELAEMYQSSVIILRSGNMVLDWTLVPHVAPAPDENRVAFKKAIRNALNLGPGEKLTNKRLVQALSRAVSRNALKDCYEKIIAGGASRMHNRVSMSLYSGPTGRAKRNIWQHEVFAGKDWIDSYWRGFQSDGNVGWMGTGDATLQVQKVRNAWQKDYSMLLGQVGSLLLPHHGSRHNFHNELIQIPGLILCLATAGNPSQYNHPSNEVVARCEAAGKRFIHISQERETGITETIELLP